MCKSRGGFTDGLLHSYRYLIRRPDGFCGDSSRLLLSISVGSKDSKGLPCSDSVPMYSIFSHAFLSLSLHNTQTILYQSLTHHLVFRIVQNHCVTLLNWNKASARVPRSVKCYLSTYVAHVGMQSSPCPHHQLKLMKGFTKKRE